MSDFEDTLATRLHERVADETPDLTALLARSVRTGTRLRRRRRLGGAAAAVAAVAAIGGVGALVTSGGSESDPGVAQEPTASATPTPQAPVLVDGAVLTAPSGTEVKVHDSGSYDGAGSFLQGPGAGGAPFVLVFAPGYTEEDLTWAWDEFGPQDLWSSVPAAGLTDREPVTVPEGWSCEWFLIDDKAACTAADGGVAGLVIRPAADHAEWSSSPDKGGAGSGAYVTEVHDGIFLSVQGGAGTTDAELRALRDGLVWK